MSARAPVRRWRGPRAKRSATTSREGSPSCKIRIRRPAVRADDGRNTVGGASPTRACSGSPQRGPATHSASLRAFTPVFDVLWTRVNALLLSRLPLAGTNDEGGQTEQRDARGSAMLERSRLGSVPARVWRDECRRAVG